MSTINTSSSTVKVTQAAQAAEIYSIYHYHCQERFLVYLNADSK